LSLEASSIIASELPISSALVTARTTTAIPILPTAAAVTAITTSTPETTTFFTRPGLVDGHAATLEIFAIQFLDGFLGLAVAGHFHEAKPTRSAGEFILNQRNRCNLPECCEQFPDFFLGGVEGQVANIDVHIFPFSFTKKYLNFTNIEAGTSRSQSSSGGECRYIILS
jgi:hypothetical protein